MTIKSRNITHYEGDSLTLEVTTKMPDGSRVDLTNSDIQWVLAKSAADTPELSKDTASGGIEVVDGPNGEFNVTVDAGDTEGLVGEYYHEAEIRDSAGNEFTIFVGTILIEESAI